MTKPRDKAATPTVAVIGGGISGLAAAHRLITAPHPVHVILIEAGPRLGGCLRNAELAGIRVDTGPESLLARVPWGTDLLEELGLEPKVVTPAALGAHLWLRGALRPLPAGLMTGRASAAAVRSAGLLTLPGQLRAGLDLLLPGKPQLEDESIATAIGTRLGPEVVTAIADPLFGGIYAGSTARLSTHAAMPIIAAARARGGSLLRAIRTNQPDKTTDGPVFVSLRGGLGQLPEVIGRVLADGGAEIRLRTTARSIAPGPASTIITLEGGATLKADAVVLALEAPHTATLLREHASHAAQRLDEISNARVAIASFAFEAGTRLPASSGFLAGRGEGLTISASTLSSQKWPELAPEGPVLVRCSIGRTGSPPPADDDVLIRQALADLRTTIGVGVGPLDARVDRYDHALPQHEVGHLARLDTIEAVVAQSLPNVSLAGAWTRGIGIAACIRDGRKSAERAIMAAQLAPKQEK